MVCLCTSHRAPAYMQNAYITAGYRVDYHWTTCIKSMFKLHNETLNVWTHFLGFLLFVALTVQVVYTYGHGSEYVSGIAHKLAPQSLSHSISKAVDDFNANNYTGIPHIPHSWEFEQYATEKISEMKEYAENVKDQIQSGVNTMQHHMDTYIKDIEESVHNFHAPDFSHLKEDLEEFNDKMNKPVTPKSKLPMIVFLISACVCFMGSTLFHLLGCQSERAFNFFLKVDYSGISVLIAGSIVPFICYIFHELTHWQYIYLSLLTMVAAAVIFVSFSEKFSADAYQPYRAGLFVLMACFLIVPFGHMIVVYGMVDLGTFSRFVCSALLYVAGVVLYVLRFPERLCPGKFDIWFHSHQVFHMFIVAAAFVWYTFMSRLWQGMHSHVSILS